MITLIPFYAMGEEPLSVWSERLADIEAFVKTGVVATSTALLPQTITSVSESLSFLPSTIPSEKRHLVTLEDKLRIVGIKLLLLKSIADIRDWRTEPYDFHADLTKLYKGLSVDAIYYDANKTKLDEIPDIKTRDEMARFREEKSRLISLSRQDILLSRIFEDKINEINRDLHWMQRNNPDQISQIKEMIQKSLPKGELQETIVGQLNTTSKSLNDAKQERERR